MIQKYSKIPVEIEAIQFTGANIDEVKDFLGENYGGSRIEKRIDGRREIWIKTLEDGSLYQVEHVASEGDFIIKGVKGEFYACKPDIFNLTYKLV